MRPICGKQHRNDVSLSKPCLTQLSGLATLTVGPIILGVWDAGSAVCRAVERASWGSVAESFEPARRNVVPAGRHRRKFFRTDDRRRDRRDAGIFYVAASPVRTPRVLGAGSRITPCRVLLFPAGW